MCRRRCLSHAARDMVEGCGMWGSEAVLVIVTLVAGTPAEMDAGVDTSTEAADTDGDPAPAVDTSDDPVAIPMPDVAAIK